MRTHPYATHAMITKNFPENVVEQEKACTKKRKTITKADLPLCCPMPDERLWDGHPRVYLDIVEMGSVECPYCGTKYVLTDPRSPIPDNRA